MGKSWYKWVGKELVELTKEEKSVIALDLEIDEDGEWGHLPDNTTVYKLSLCEKNDAEAICY